MTAIGRFFRFKQSLEPEVHWLFISLGYYLPKAYLPLVRCSRLFSLSSSFLLFDATINFAYDVVSWASSQCSIIYTLCGIPCSMLYHKYTIYGILYSRLKSLLHIDSIGVNCGQPPSITNGSPGTPTRTTFEGTVIYSCNSGYTPESTTVTCLASGSWSTRPVCERM